MTSPWDIPYLGVHAYFTAEMLIMKFCILLYNFRA